MTFTFISFLIGVAMSFRFSVHSSRSALVLTAFVAAAVGCGDSDATTGAGGNGGGTAATTTGVSVSTTTGGGETSVGLACTNDSACGADGKCIKASDDDVRFGGGPAGGYCTVSCTANDDCPGTDSLCVLDEDGAGECLLGCTFGDPVLEFVDTALDEMKCHGREDLRCQTYGDSELTVCRPTCGTDAQCGSLKCDPRLAVCVTTPTTGLADGTKCDPDAADCEGICVSFTDGQSMCSNWCVLGGELDGNDCGGLEGGLCTFRPTANGAGDYGFCTPGCSKQDDCQNPDFWCFSNTFSTVGYCFGAADCPNGQSDCTSGNTCTDTEYGPLCLDPAIPFDGNGTGGGGGMGGSGGMGGAGGTGGAGGMGGAGGVAP